MTVHNTEPVPHCCETPTNTNVSSCPECQSLCFRSITLSPSTMAGDPPQPRLCHIAKVDNFDGYGFNLHAEKNKPGQFVGKIDPGSPAEVAGLKESDREQHVICHHQLKCILTLRKNRSLIRPSWRRCVRWLIPSRRQHLEESYQL